MTVREAQKCPKEDLLFWKMSDLGRLSGKRFSVSLIGFGNVGKHLVNALHNAGHSILEIFSRDPLKIEKGAEAVGARVVTDVADLSHGQADIYFLTVPDDAIEKVVRKFRFPPHSIVVHTSGSTSIEKLNSLSQAKGVFYPLQTFSSRRNLDFSSIPVMIEADSPKTLKKLEVLARSLSADVYFLNSEQRKHAHLSAVFASNFVNHLIFLSQELLNKQGIIPAVLDPLIRETVFKALETGALEGQTGPARRGDRSTLNLQKSLLEKNPNFLKIYEVLSDSIRIAYSNK